MIFFNTRIIALLLAASLTLSLSFAEESSLAPAPTPTADAPTSSISSAPAAAPGPSSASSYLNYVPFDVVQDGVAVPMDEQAKDIQYLETNMAKAANQMEQFLQNVVEKRQKDSATDDSTKECLVQCAEEYDSAVNSLKRGLVNVNAKDFVKTSAELTAFAGNIDTCDDCFGDAGSDPEFQKFDEWVSGVSNDCLEKISKYVTANAD